MRSLFSCEVCITERGTLRIFVGWFWVVVALVVLWWACA